MLTQRRARILEIIVGEYVTTAVPVGSAAIVRRHDLGVSAATIRNEMARLEEEGYISHPYTSAGRVPSDKGYRYYVERLMEEEELPWELRETIRHQFHQSRREREAWLHLAASVVAGVVRNAAVVTVPRPVESRLKHLELVAVRDFVALVVAVLEGALLRQQVVHLPEALSQQELAAMAARLNGVCTGLSANEITERSPGLTAVEGAVMDAVGEILEATDRGSYEDAYLEGVRYVLNQPEFARADRMLDILDVLDERNLPRIIPFGALAGEGVSIVIGAENRPAMGGPRGEAIGMCSVVVTRYGSPAWGSGAMAVLGPTRMHYPRIVSTVRYVSELINELMADYYSEPKT
jgi:heat-inducible transcriptional repressor